MTVTACDRPHDVEVISLLHADELDGDFPGDDALSRWAFQQCIDAFEEYVGEAYGRSTLEIEHRRSHRDAVGGRPTRRAVRRHIA